ncbi:hypothetical protein M422DRAFT_774120 [Sphaerobolus stellatus SS14]|nr:hypothetical protein M422DRAFT_774120 [Sphaerobolus stellatus SS14]
MEVEPLQDTVPPRHQVESDESEDEDAYPLQVGAARKTTRRQEPVVEFEWTGQQEKREALVVALDDAGRQWIRGVQLGDAKGKVTVDGVKIASIYVPAFADTFVVRLEMRLPLYVIHPVTSTLLSALHPTNVVVIDSYPLPSYISSSPSSFNAPIRFLRTSAASQQPSLPAIEPFSPPNIIQTPAASFLSTLEFPPHATPSTLLLLPSGHILPPAPPVLQGQFGPEMRDDWETATLTKLHKAICTMLGKDSEWKATDRQENISGFKRPRRGDIGEGGMYI